MKKKERIHPQCRRPGFNPWVGKIPWGEHDNPLQYSGLENPHGHGRLQSMGSQRVRHDWSIGVSASSSVFPMNIQDWFLLGLTGLISFMSKGFSRVLSITKVQKHQFFGTQPCLWSNSYIHTWLRKNHNFDCIDLCQQSDVSAFEYAV